MTSKRTPVRLLLTIPMAMHHLAAMHTHHAIDYIEFGVRDLDEAKRFFGAVFAWEFNDYGPKYCGIKGPTREVGGFSQCDDVSPGGPLVVLFSEDLDATYAAVSTAGGRIVAEPFPFPGGRRFEFLDPSGNRLGVWTPA